MPEFHLDTSGAIECPKATPDGRPYAFPVPLKWADLDAFTQGYVEALFFTSQGDGEPGTDNESGLWVESEDEPGLWSNEFGFSDLAPETLAAIIDDCAKFQADFAALLTDAYARDYGADQAGRDFWYTRNGHGVGFWDREELEPVGAAWDSVQIPLDQWTDETRRLREVLKAAAPGQLLTDASKAFRSLDAYLGDDGKVYLS